MVKLLSSAVVTALILGLAQATPVDKKESEKVTAVHPIGFDPDYGKNGRLRPGPIPEELSIDDLVLDESVNQTEPVHGTEPDKELQKRFINGVDDRYRFTDTYLFPFRAIGKVQWSNGVWCTGALVGPKTVLTAAHCIVSGASGTFSPGYVGAAPLGTANVVSTLKGQNPQASYPCQVAGDWAIMIIDRSFGTSYGYFGVKTAEQSKVDMSIFSNMGYPGDKDNGNIPWRTDGTRIQGFRNNWDCNEYSNFYTDTDSAGGQSGSPLWETVIGKPYIWGTLSTSYAVGSTAWAAWGAGPWMIAVINALNNSS